MKQSKKYDYRVTQEGSSWRAEIVRRVSSKNLTVSKGQDGFATEAEAQEWAKKELQEFITNQSERNKRSTR